MNAHSHAAIRERSVIFASTHTCAGYGCVERVAREQLMCADHLGLVPKWLRAELEACYDLTAEFRWPLNLVERAIRTTMAESDLKAYVERLAASEQVTLFAVPVEGPAS